MNLSTNNDQRAATIYSNIDIDLDMNIKKKLVYLLMQEKSGKLFNFSHYQFFGKRLYV